MYQEYFGFRALPFASAPDPKVFYLNPVYQAALGTLRYGVLAKKGLIVLTGAVGTGKTALLRKLFDDLGSAARPIWVVSSRITLGGVLRTALTELDAQPQSTELSAMIDALHNVLLHSANGDIVTCLIIEEAQRLDADMLEGLRQLCNFEADSQKLLQLILVGQPQFMKKLDEPEHHSLKQRVALHCRLFPFTRSELDRYIAFQLQAAGYHGSSLFDSAAIARIAHYSGGIPRLVNTICDNALLAASRSARAEISPAVIDDVANDMGLTTEQPAVAPALRIDTRSVSRKLPPADWQGATLKGESRPEWAPAKDLVVTAPRQRRAARIFSAALLALIPLGGAGWALYSNGDVPFLESLKSRFQVASSRFAQPTASAENEVTQPSSARQAAAEGGESAALEDDGANRAASPQAQTAAALEATVLTPQGRRGKEKDDDSGAGAPSQSQRAPVFETSAPASHGQKHADIRTKADISGDPPRLQPIKDAASERRLLEADVQKAIRNRAIEGVSVRLVDGTVYLDGLVASERQRSLAEQAALGVRDVVSVKNQIGIRP
jgi:general secretion pathway protein A